MNIKVIKFGCGTNFNDAASDMLQQLWIHGDLLTKVYEEDYGSEKLCSTVHKETQ